MIIDLGYSRPVATSAKTTTMAAGPMFKPTSTRCPSAWQPNPGRTPLSDAENLFREPGPPQTPGANFGPTQGRKPRLRAAGCETIYASIYRGSTDKGIRSSKRTNCRGWLSMTSFKQIEANHR